MGFDCWFGGFLGDMLLKVLRIEGCSWVNPLVDENPMTFWFFEYILPTFS
jgi:hypothetical protein